MADATPQDAEEVKESIDHSVQRPRDQMMEEIVAVREIEVLEDIVGEEAMEEIVREMTEERGLRKKYNKKTRNPQYGSRMVIGLLL